MSVKLRKYKKGFVRLKCGGEKWGSEFSLEDTKVMLFTRKKKLRREIYGSDLERVEGLHFLGVDIDLTSTWREHIRNVEDKCKKKG